MAVARKHSLFFQEACDETVALCCWSSMDIWPYSIASMF